MRFMGPIPEKSTQTVTQSHLPSAHRTPEAKVFFPEKIFI